MIQQIGDSIESIGIARYQQDFQVADFLLYLVQHIQQGYDLRFMHRAHHHDRLPLTDSAGPTPPVQPIERCDFAVFDPERESFVFGGAGRLTELGLDGERLVEHPPGEGVDPAELVAFETNGRQGINYLRGTWHMPLIALESGQRYLIIERSGEGANCDEHSLEEPITLVDSA